MKKLEVCKYCFVGFHAICIMCKHLGMFNCEKGHKTGGEFRDCFECKERDICEYDNKHYLHLSEGIEKRTFEPDYYCGSGEGKDEEVDS